MQLIKCGYIFLLAFFIMSVNNKSEIFSSFTKIVNMNLLLPTYYKFIYTFITIVIFKAV